MNANQNDTEEPMMLEIPVFVGGRPDETAGALALQTHQIVEHDLFLYAVANAARPDISLDTIRFVAAGLGVRGGQKETRLVLPPYPLEIPPGGALSPSTSSVPAREAGEENPAASLSRHAPAGEDGGTFAENLPRDMAIFLRLAMGAPHTPPVVQEFLAGGKTFPSGASVSPWQNKESVPASPEAWISVVPSLDSRELLVGERGSAERRHKRMGMAESTEFHHNEALAPALKERVVRIFLVAAFAAVGFWLLRHGGLFR